MAQVPYPISADNPQDFRFQVYELIRKVFEERIGGLNMGDVFTGDGDVITLSLASNSGLEKTSNELKIQLNSSGGLQITSTGLSSKIKTGGGLASDANGLYISGTAYGFGGVHPSSGEDIAADALGDTLNISGGDGITVTGTASTDTAEIKLSGTTANDFKITSDSKKLFLGAGQDMTAWYDGTSGNIKTSDVAASDLNIDCGTDKTVALVVPVYEDLQVSINNIAKGASAPTDRYYAHGVGSGIAYPVLGFAKGNYIWFDVQTSHAMKLNTALECHIHFVLPNTTSVGHKIVWQLDVIAAAINGTWAVPSGSPYTVTHTVATGDDTSHRILSFGNIAAVNSTVSTVYKCKLTRIDGEATEYASEAYLEFVDCHYQKDTMGSRQITTK